jgi:glycosyltransferase involved in cell wall biosynthesis
MTNPLVVHHFGPDPGTVGGMASVIRLCATHNIGGERVEAHPTWRPGSPLSPSLIASCARSLLRARAGEVAHLHLSERGSFLREGAFVAPARTRGLVTVVTIHGAAFAPFAREHPRLVSAVLARAHAIACLDEEALGIVHRVAGAVHAEIVPNPVVVAERCTHADDADELVLFAGEIGLRKGADVLHRAWRAVAERRPRARCLMVGPVADFTPPATERLELRPPVEPGAVGKLLERARVIALPARAEGMPMILTEAMSHARPFVGTPVGAIPELAEAGGVLVPVEDAAALADRLTELLADSARARALGDEGRRFCSRTRGIGVIDARLRELYAAASAAARATRGPQAG